MGGELGDAGFVELAETFGDHPVVLFLRRERGVDRNFIGAHSAPVALREGVLYARVLQPAFHYELEQISKSEILRKLKQRFGGKTIRDVRFRVG